MDDFLVVFGMILSLIGRKKGFSCQGFYPDIDLEASSFRQLFDQPLLFYDLSVTLYEEWKVELLINHSLKEFFPLFVFIEVVRSEDYHFHSGSFGQPQTFHRGFNRL